MGVDGSGTVCDSHGLRDEGTNREVARADGPYRSDGRTALG